MQRRHYLAGVGVVAGGGMLGYRALARTPGPVTAVEFEGWGTRATDPYVGDPEIELHTGRASEQIRIRGEFFVGGTHHAATLDDISYQRETDEVIAKVTHHIPLQNLPGHLTSLSDAGRNENYEVSITVERLPSRVTAIEQPYSGSERITTIDNQG